MAEREAVERARLRGIEEVIFRAVWWGVLWTRTTLHPWPDVVAMLRNEAPPEPPPPDSAALFDKARACGVGTWVKESASG